MFYIFFLVNNNFFNIFEIFVFTQHFMNDLILRYKLKFNYIININLLCNTEKLFPLHLIA